MTTTRYAIIDKHTGQQVGRPYNDRVRARRRADRLDNEYGAYRYSVRSTEPTSYIMIDTHNQRQHVGEPSADYRQLQDWADQHNTTDEGDRYLVVTFKAGA